MHLDASNDHINTLQIPSKNCLLFRPQNILSASSRCLCTSSWPRVENSVVPWRTYWIPLTFFSHRRKIPITFESPDSTNGPMVRCETSPSISPIAPCFDHLPKFGEIASGFEGAKGLGVAGTSSNGGLVCFSGKILLKKMDFPLLWWNTRGKIIPRFRIWVKYDLYST